ncbi:MAG: histidine phosphatase family protein [Halochromatium sp.]|nr:histidine phosphatase family protein [Halochromatium sp.]
MLTEQRSYRFADLIRHGEVEGDRCFRGRRDDPLSAAGWAQLEAATGIPVPIEGAIQGSARSAARSAAKGRIKDRSGTVAWDRLLCSPAARCARFTERLSERMGLPVEPLEALRERDFGAWEGLRADQIPLADLSRFWADPDAFDPPDSEPFRIFRQRVMDGWRQALEGGGEQLLLLTHGGVIRVILGALLGIPSQRLILLEVPTACRTRLRLPTQGGLPSLIAHGRPDV